MRCHLHLATVEEAEALRLKDMLGMNWYVEGVEGKVPGK